MKTKDPPSGGAVGALENATFAVAMAIMAYVGRENPLFVYPEVLWAFLAVLAANLLSVSYLSRRLSLPRRMGFSVLVNVVGISVVIAYSGGPESYFWVMYLFPIFSASIALERRGFVIAAAAIFLCLLWVDRWALRPFPGPDAVQVLVKALTLLAAAGVTRRVALRERRAVAQLAREQAGAVAERARMRETLQHMDRLATMGTLSASITHELRGPLMTILGSAEVALDGPPDAKTMTDSMKRIESSAKRCAKIIQDMLSFARREKQERAPGDLNALVRRCVELKRHDWLGGEIAVEESYAADLPPVRLSDSEIQQVVFNLLTNAEHALRLNHGTSGGRVRVRTASGDGKARIEVSDDGPGIAPETLKRIWEPFFTTKPKGQGTGLGLSISLEIVKSHGGTLTAQSKPGAGATFVIELPLA